MVETDGAFGTDDLALAVVLISEGYSYKLERLNSKQVRWIFNPPEHREEEFDELLGAYDERAVRVEPRSFMIEYARVRGEMFRFLGAPDRRRHPDAPSVST